LDNPTSISNFLWLKPLYFINCISLSFTVCSIGNPIFIGIFFQKDLENLENFSNFAVSKLKSKLKSNLTDNKHRINKLNKQGQWDFLTLFITDFLIGTTAEK
jgi:hypothetical protein